MLYVSPPLPRRLLSRRVCQVWRVLMFLRLGSQGRAWRVARRLGVWLGLVQHGLASASLLRHVLPRRSATHRRGSAWQALAGVTFLVWVLAIITQWHWLGLVARLVARLAVYPRRVSQWRCRRRWARFAGVRLWLACGAPPALRPPVPWSCYLPRWAQW